MSIIEQPFKQLVSEFSKLNFVHVIRSINCKVESLIGHRGHNDWEEFSASLNHDVDELFSARIIFKAKEFERLDQLIRKFPLSVTEYFTLSKRYVYTPDLEPDLEPDEVFDLRILIHPIGITDKTDARAKFNEYFNELRCIIESELV